MLFPFFVIVHSIPFHFIQQFDSTIVIWYKRLHASTKLLQWWWWQWCWWWRRWWRRRQQPLFEAILSSYRAVAHSGGVGTFARYFMDKLCEWMNEWLCVCDQKCVCNHLDRIYCWPIHFQASSIVLACACAFPFPRIICFSQLTSLVTVPHSLSVCVLYSLGLIHSILFFMSERQWNDFIIYIYISTYIFKHGFTAWIAHDDFPITSYRPFKIKQHNNK